MESTLFCQDERVCFAICLLCIIGFRVHRVKHVIQGTYNLISERNSNSRPTRVTHKSQKQYQSQVLILHLARPTSRYVNINLIIIFDAFLVLFLSSQSSILGDPTILYEGHRIFYYPFVIWYATLRIMEFSTQKTRTTLNYPVLPIILNSYAIKNEIALKLFTIILQCKK